MDRPAARFRSSVQRLVKRAMACFLVACGHPNAASADPDSPPAGYYASTVGLTGSALDTALRQIIDSHTVRSYDQLRQDLAVTDRDPAFPPPANQPTAVTRIFLMYSFGWDGYSRSGVWDSAATWNREHTWPDSRGIGQPDSGPDYSDLHQIRAANTQVNSARGHQYFDIIGGTTAAHAAAPQSRSNGTTVWEPPDVDKGWIARSLAYMATRYDGGESNTTDLVLVETPPASVSGNPPQMGRKSTLLRWNRLHPPSAWERRRNQIIYDRYQKNRNPFIDFPEFADAIYETPFGRETRFTWRYRHFSLAELANEAISGDLADPDGDGRSNLLECAEGDDPRSAGAAAYPRVEAAPSGRQRLTYLRLRDRALSGLQYSIEVSPDLASWDDPAALVEQAVVTEGVIERVTVEYTAAPSSFARVRIQR